MSQAERARQGGEDERETAVLDHDFVGMGIGVGSVEGLVLRQ